MQLALLSDVFSLFASELWIFASLFLSCESVDTFAKRAALALTPAQGHAIDVDVIALAWAAEPEQFRIKRLARLGELVCCWHRLGKVGDHGLGS